MFKDEAAQLRYIALENKRLYAERHGYDFFDAYEDPELRPRLDQTVKHTIPAYVSKYLVVRHYLERYDWILWVDADTLIMNHSPTLEKLGALDLNFDMVVTVAHAMDW